MPSDSDKSFNHRRAVSLVAKRAELVDVRLVEANLRQRIRSGPLPRKSGLSVEVTIIKEDMESLNFRIRPRFKLTLEYENEKTDEVPVEILAEFQLSYLMKSAVQMGSRPELVLMEFGQKFGLREIWPFWREFAQSMFGRMGLPLFTVPPFREASVSGWKQKDKSSDASSIGRIRRKKRR